MESKSLQFQDFNGDSVALGSLIASSWSENHEQGLDYTPRFLESCFQYPGMTPALAPVLMDGDRPAAFVAAFPRTLAVNGHRGRYALLTFFTVAPGYKGQGLGVRVWTECLRRVRLAGFDGALHYCVDGNVSNHVTVVGASAAGYSAQRILSIPYLRAFLRSQPAEPVPALDPNRAAAALVEAAEPLAARLPIARQWSPEEALWQCHGRHGALTQWDEASGALLNGYVLPVCDAARTPCLFLDEVHWGRLTDEEKAPFLKAFLGRAAGQATIATVPLPGYTDPAYLKAAGFRGAPRQLHAYLTLWTTEAAPVEALYADVL